MTCPPCPAQTCRQGPTESSTIFMQQLGRGLRRTHRKAVLTVLDFVGYHRREFQFGRRFSALTGVHGK